MRDVVRLLCIFFSLFYFYLMYTNFVTIWHTSYLSFDIYIYIYMLMYVYSPISSCVVSFLSLCTCFLLFVCSLLFLFHTKMLWWVLFKVFQKYKLSKSFLPWTLFLQSFSRVCIGIDFIVFNKWIRVEWFMTSLIPKLLSLFVTNYKG